MTPTQLDKSLRELEVPVVDGRADLSQLTQAQVDRIMKLGRENVARERMLDIRNVFPALKGKK